MNAEAPIILAARPGAVTRLAARSVPDFRAHLLLALLSLLSVFPIYWMIVSALRAENDIFSTELWPAALIIPHGASAFAIMIFYHAIRSFPEELVDAARMDGGGHLTVLFRVMVPNLRPALASLGILLFISSWNEYFWPLLVTRSVENAVVQIGPQMFMTQEGDQWGPLMAAATLVSLPVLALYLVLQRQIIESFVKSGIR